MKTSVIKKLVLLLAVGAVIPLLSSCGDSPESQKTKADAKAALEKTKDTAQDVMVQGKELAKTGAEKAGVLATNVVADVKIGMAKAGDVATNVVAKVKEGAHKVGDAMTNAVSNVGDKVQSMTK